MATQNHIHKFTVIHLGSISNGTSRPPPPQIIIALKLSHITGRLLLEGGMAHSVFMFPECALMRH